MGIGRLCYLGSCAGVCTIILPIEIWGESRGKVAGTPKIATPEPLNGLNEGTLWQNVQVSMYWDNMEVVLGFAMENKDASVCFLPPSLL